jgi:putative DNA-binding protein
MSTLRELQAAFRRGLLGESDGDAAGELDALIEGDGLAPSARLLIYRHHVLETLTAALRSVYPVTCRLVHERFFAYAADRYIREHPPAGPCLFEYGASLPAFLAGFPPCRELAYLPDVARLEWALHAAAHAADAVPLAPTALRELGADRVMQAAFRLHPSLTLLESPWPVDRIWRAIQPDADPAATIDLASGGVCLEVLRVGEEPVFRVLEPADYALRHALAAGGELEAAAPAALARNPAFDLARALRALFESDVLVGVILRSRADRP